jgi:hypothetical protein
MKAKNKLIFLIILLISCLSEGPLYGQMLLQKNLPKELQRELASPPPKQDIEEARDLIVKPNTIYRADNLRDPFQSYLERPVGTPVYEPAAIPVPMPVLHLQGLFWGGNFPQAIINNKVVKEGDTIAGVKIISIKKDGVTVLFSNIEHKLSPPGISNLESVQRSQKGGRQ